MINKVVLFKDTKISEEDYGIIQDKIDNGQLDYIEVFSYVSLVNVYEDSKDDAYWAAYSTTTDLNNDDETVDLPVSVRYVDYSKHACCYRVTFQSGNVKDYIIH